MVTIMMLLSQTYPLAERARAAAKAIKQFKDPLKAIAVEGLRRPIGDLQRGKYLARVTTIEKLFEKLEQETDPQKQYALAYSISLLWLENGMKIGARIEHAESAMAGRGIVQEERTYCQRHAERAARFFLEHGARLTPEARERINMLTLPYQTVHESFKP